MLSHKSLKARALARPEVRAEYDRLEEEFAVLDQFLRARAAAGLTQAQVAERIGTTQSAIARLESGAGRHQPSLGTLRRYAQALGCRLELRLVKEPVRRDKGHSARSTRVKAALPR
jgi:transcriptional regulator with XRE-family HTH domain